MKSLSERIRETAPCRLCRPTAGVWMCDGQGNPIAGRRCNCRKGHLLWLSDESRRRKSGESSVPPLLAGLDDAVKST